ncbi:hypothetical protein NXV05_08270 [Parabacteroides johnsonii]|nr:hypothetical protein [Parabacteroides johnsonii]
MFDISLLYELKKGNREAFNGVFRYYYPRMMAYVASMVEQKVAEDIVQDVFLYVWENREKLYVSDGFHSYLFQSAYTRCLDYFKKNLSIEKIPFSYLREIFGRLSESVERRQSCY